MPFNCCLFYKHVVNIISIKKNIMTTTANLESALPNTAVINNKLEQQAQFIIKKYAALSVSVVLIPVPFLDLAALAAIQLKGIQEISKLHSKDFSDHLGKPILTTSLATLTAHPVARIGASLLKIVPVFGPVLATVLFPGYAAASTYAICNLFHRHFSNGGTILDFDATKYKQAYNNLLNKFKVSEKGFATNETNISEETATA